jgi:hypothetical protein
MSRKRLIFTVISSVFALVILMAWSPWNTFRYHGDGKVSDGADSPVIMSQGPGEYREDPGGTTIQAKNPVIIFINWGSWAFTWIDGQVKKIMP